ncbi:unnamed protein product [Bursaphelenchus okinawaensis]|uniref:Phlebovirus glycoprotein G2 fusion domain-containing protein n=1 Tax=Bursaphelenchus okinawaensis TaxID=465554 RepID=A0A811KED9_9BILA|nr:unnamed protein product [Bursaphelenchus okinawaensis]CAG9101679.1 unnamed protein product [Bursaphelenchus okinawaensis]
MAAKPHAISYRSPKHLYPLELDPQIKTDTAKEPVSAQPPRKPHTSSKKVLLNYVSILCLLPLALADNETTYEETTRTPKVPDCTLDHCAPWAWECCSALQKTEIQYKCNFHEWYYTRDYIADTESVHRCDHTSSCYESTCEEVDLDDEIDEFSKSVRKAPSYSHCTRACGGLVCGCFFLTPACNFWRLYASPNLTYIYRVGQCPTWTPVVHLIVQQQNTTIPLTLSNGESYNHEGITFTLQSTSQPQLPILQLPLIINDDKAQAIMTAASTLGQPIVGSVGTMQCDEKSARNFRCTFPHEICNCIPSDFDTKCTCTYTNPMELWDLPEVRLPLSSGPVTINYLDKEITNNNPQSYYMQN